MTSGHREKIFAAAAAMAILLIQGCGDGDSSDDMESEEAQQQQQQVQSVQGHLGQGGDQRPTIFGTWVRQACTADEDDTTISSSLALQDDQNSNDQSGGSGGGQTYSKESYIFETDGTISFSMEQFLEEGCTEDSKIVTLGFEGTFVIQNPVETQTRASEMDMTVEDVVLIVHHEQFIKSLNSGDEVFICNKTDWEVDVPHSIKEDGCETDDEDFIELGDKVYDIVGIVDGKLYLGDAEDEDSKSSADDRPTELDLEEVGYEKQDAE